MCKLLDAIESVGVAADNLTRVCARHAAIADAVANDNPFVTALKRQFLAASVTPTDLLTVLGRIK